MFVVLIRQQAMDRQLGAMMHVGGVWVTWREGFKVCAMDGVIEGNTRTRRRRTCSEWMCAAARAYR